jgi:hypothetical protein
MESGESDSLRPVEQTFRPVPLLLYRRGGKEEDREEDKNDVDMQMEMMEQPKA